MPPKNNVSLEFNRFVEECKGGDEVGIRDQGEGIGYRAKVE